MILEVVQCVLAPLESLYARVCFQRSVRSLGEGLHLVLCSPGDVPV